VDRPATGPAAVPGELGVDGWLAGVRRVPSPHCDPRPVGAAVELLVVHNISLPPGVYGGELVERLFLGTLALGVDPYVDRLQGLRVSAHFLIARSGSLTQFVSCADRAWHAGVSSFEGRERCNDFSVGVELEGTDTDPYTPAQYATLATLLRRLRTGLPLRAVRGHSHIAPGRKTDPGPAFDWARCATEADLPRSWLP